MIAKPIITGMQINTVLRTVAGLSDDGDVHLSILMFSLVVATRACGVSQANVFECLKLAFARDLEIVPLVLDTIH